MSKGSWRGKPLEDHSKDELIDIALEMHQILTENASQAARDREMLLGIIGQRRGVPNWKVAFYIYGGLVLILVVIGLALRFCMLTA